MHKIPITSQYRQVYVDDRVTPEIELNVLMQQLAESDRTPPLPTCRTRADWVRAQYRDGTANDWVGDERVFTVQDELLVFQADPDAPNRTIVPQALQEPLKRYTYHNMCHMSAGKVYNVLKKNFFFKLSLIHI